MYIRIDDTIKHYFVISDHCSKEKKIGVVSDPVLVYRSSGPVYWFRGQCALLLDFKVYKKAGNVENIKPVHFAQVSYFPHFL